MVRRWQITCGRVAGFGLLALGQIARGDPPENVPALIQQLGAPDQAARENAETRLVALGLAARPALIAALDSKDLEVQVRAARAMEKLRQLAARHETLWNDTVASSLINNMVAGQIGERQMVYAPTSAGVTARDVSQMQDAGIPQPLRSNWTSRITEGRTGWLALAGNRLLVTTSTSHLLALDAATGDKLWTYDGTVGQIGGVAAVARSGRGPAATVPGLSPPCVDGDVAYVGGAEMVTAIDLKTGAALWRTPLREGVIGAPTVSNDQVFVSSPNGVTIYNRKTGALMNRVADGKAIYSAPLVVDGRIIVGTLEGLAAFDTQKIQPVWVHDASTMKVELVNAAGARSSTIVPAPAAGRVSTGMPAPAIDHGILLYSNIDTLYALDPATGAERWHWQPSLLPGAPETTTPPPAAAAATVSILQRTAPTISAPTFLPDGRTTLLATTLGLFALDTKTGCIDWEFHPPNAVLLPTTAITTTPVQPVATHDVVQALLTQRETRPAPAAAARRGNVATVPLPANAAVANATTTTITSRLIGLPLHAADKPAATRP